jgi:hypothetical protein
VKKTGDDTDDKKHSGTGIGSPYCHTIPGEGGRRAGVKGYRGEVEYFGVYSSDTGKCYLVPVDAVPIAGARLPV